MTAVLEKPGKQFGTFDGKDNRRDLWRLLGTLDRATTGRNRRLGSHRRKAFLWYCCKALEKKFGVRGMGVTLDSACEYTVSVTYHDLVALTMHPGWLDLETIAAALELYTRKELKL